MVQKGKINVKERFSDGEIDLSMSDLDEVPVKEIAALKKTTSLDLSNNRLALLPSSFTVLTNLTKLDLSKNELAELPEDFGNLSKLKYLDLYKNNLDRLPLSFGQLSSLKFLDLKDNPLIPAIAKVAGPCVDTKGCQQCAKDVVNFYRRLQEEVDNEVAMRKKARQKQLEINQQKKQDEKKKQKKEKQSKFKKDSEKNDHKNNPKVTTKKQSKKEERWKQQDQKQMSNILFLFSALAVICSILMFTLLNLPRSPLAEASRSYLKIGLHWVVEKLPDSWRPHVISFVTLLDSIRAIVNNTIFCVVFEGVHKIFALVNNPIRDAVRMLSNGTVTAINTVMGKTE